MKLRLLVVISCTLFVAAGLAPGASAYDLAMWVEGETQGAIECSSVEGREGSIPLLAFSHDLFIPIDASTGLPTGKRVHRPVVVRARLGCAGAFPKLYQALVGGERLTAVQIRFYRPDRGGGDVNFFTITLEQAQIVNISAVDILDESEPAAMIGFTYSRIIWTFEDGGVESEDNWRGSGA